MSDGWDQGPAPGGVAEGFAVVGNTGEEVGVPWRMSVSFSFRLYHEIKKICEDK